MEQSQISAYQQAHAAALNNPYWYSDRPVTRGSIQCRNYKNASRDCDRCFAESCKTKNRVPPVAAIFGARRRVVCNVGAPLWLFGVPQMSTGISASEDDGPSQTDFSNRRKNRSVIWCMVTIIPRELNYPQGHLTNSMPHEFNRHLKDSPYWGGLIQTIPGSIDFSLEKSRVGKYWQPHWHFTLHTHDPELLREDLKELFPPIEKHDYPVDVTEAFDLHFLPYIHKVIKINDLLRRGQTHLPELLLMLDRINPLDLLVLHGLVLSAQDGGFDFELAGP